MPLRRTISICGQWALSICGHKHSGLKTRAPRASKCQGGVHFAAAAPDSCGAGGFARFFAGSRVTVAETEAAGGGVGAAELSTTGAFASSGGALALSPPSIGDATTGGAGSPTLGAV